METSADITRDHNLVSFLMHVYKFEMRTNVYEEEGWKIVVLSGFIRHVVSIRTLITATAVRLQNCRYVATICVLRLLLVTVRM